MTALGHHKGTNVTPFSLQKGHHRDRIGAAREEDRLVTPSAREIRLPKQQLKIYDWFQERGSEGVFNKPLIQRETGIAYTTIRKALRKFEDLRMLTVCYDESLKVYEYRINPQIQVKRVNVGSVSLDLQVFRLCS